ncbi:MAG: ethanolamine ammonia lyase-activating protein [Tateyamaria sp.]|jgi:oxalate decarboxylase/phosphoglucose isomerase-like protein (cupin superfamily)|nr:ethanolamine ammonia lyase-activating protein [Tateyamaria sp.]
MNGQAIVSDQLAAKFKTEKETPYTRFIASEGLDLINGNYVPSLHEVELKPWARRGGSAVFMNHDASRTTNDCYVMEIPVGGKLNPHRQLFEETILILSGRGSTVVWDDSGAKVSFEWGPGAIFGIPLNAHHQHFNGSGSAPARYIGVTNMPPLMNVFEEPDFIFGTAHDFKGRFSGEPEYFAESKEMQGLLLETNYVADAVNLPLIHAKERGAGGGHIRFQLAKCSMNSHISQFPVGTYKKCHRHGPGAHVILLSGTGYSLMWPEGGTPKRYDWKPGSMIVPPNMWYHQHFNTGTTPARYLAFKYEGVAIRNEQGVPKAWISQRIGGDQIDYADESQEVRTMFADALAENGLESNMAPAYEAEKPDLPPKPGKAA